jgi:hypothetical protein
MSEPIAQEERDIVRDIYRRGGQLADDLRAKCNWEHMTPVAVLREWPSFVRRYRRIANSVISVKNEAYQRSTDT